MNILLNGEKKLPIFFSPTHMHTQAANVVLKVQCRIGHLDDTFFYYSVQMFVFGNIEQNIYAHVKQIKIIEIQHNPMLNIPQYPPRGYR